MKPTGNGKSISSVSIETRGREIRLEKILPTASGQEVLHLSTLENGSTISQPLEFTEEELLLLLHRAIHSSVLSQDFMGKLRQKIEI